jgi:hypothetical protein
MRKAEAGRDVVVPFELESDGVAAFGRQAIFFLNHVAVGTAVPEKNGGTRRGLRQVIHLGGRANIDAFRGESGHYSSSLEQGLPFVVESVTLHCWSL